MDLAADHFHRKVINPEWNTAYKLCQSSQINKWPMRLPSHSKRLYGNCKSRPNNAHGQSNGRNEMFQVTIKLDIDEFDRARSHLSTAFCSTSKVKYMPLPGYGQDPFAGLKLGTNHPFIFPTVSRPVSRPVLLHGKRYTVVATEMNRANTSFSHLNCDEYWNPFKSDRVLTEQRKRFNELEQSKSNIKLHGITREATEMQLQKSYCLSGRQMKIRSSKATIAERLTKLQPILNLENRFVTSQKSPERPHTIVLSEFPEEQIPSQDDNSLDNIISVDIVDKGDKTSEINSEESIKSIEKIIHDCQSVVIDEDRFAKHKESLMDLVLSHLKEFSQFSKDSETSFDDSDIESSFDLLQPVPAMDEEQNLEQELNLDDYREIFANSESERIEVSAFLDMMFPQGDEILKLHYWSKIFSDLGVEYVDESIIVNVLRMKLSLHCQTTGDIVEEESVALMKLSFWIALFKSFFQTSLLTLEEWVRKSTVIICNNNAMSDELRTDYEQYSKEFIFGKFDKDQVTELDSLQTVPWILTTHSKLFHSPYSFDEMVVARYLMIPNMDNN